MANEAVPISLPRNIHAVRRTVADGATIAQYTLLKLADPNTASASSDADAFGGILAAEKTASDGVVNAGAYMTGVWDLTAAPGATGNAGDAISLSGANLVKEATEAEIQAGKFVGYADEDFSSSEVFRVRLRGGV